MARFGRSWRHLRVADLLLVDFDGAIVEGDGPLNGAAFAIHSEVHRARPDARLTYVADDALFRYGKVPETALI